MVTILPKENDWGDAFSKIGGGLVEGYTQRSDEMALQNAIAGLAPDATPRQILDAVTNTKTYGQEAKRELFKNYLGASEFEEMQKKTELSKKQLEDKAAERKAKENEKLAKQEREKADTRATLTASGKYTPKQIEEFVSSGLSPASARAVGKIEPQQYEKESEKLAAHRTNDYIKEVQEGSKAAQGDLVALDVLETLSDEGATGFKLQNALADYLESKGVKNVEAIRDPRTRAYNSVSKALFSGFGDIVKGKVSNYEFDTFKGMLAQASDSPKSAQAIVAAQKLVRNLKIEENRIMQDVIGDYAARGESPPSNISNLVEQRFRPVADQLTRDTTTQLRTILRGKASVTDPDLNKRLLEQARGTK